MRCSLPRMRSQPYMEAAKKAKPASAWASMTRCWLKMTTAATITHSIMHQQMTNMVHTYIHFVYIILDIPRTIFELLFLSNALINALNSGFLIKYNKDDIMEGCYLLGTAHSYVYCLVLYYLTLSNEHVHT